MSVPYLDVKIITTLVLFVMTFVSCYLPWMLESRFKRSLQVMSYCNCLAGGVVFGTMLLHVLPSLFDLTHLLKEEHNIIYPIGLFCAGVSFLALLAIDRLILSHSSCAIQTGLSEQPLEAGGQRPAQGHPVHDEHSQIPPLYHHLIHQDHYHLHPHTDGACPLDSLSSDPPQEDSLSVVISPRRPSVGSVTSSTGGPPEPHPASAPSLGQSPTAFPTTTTTLVQSPSHIHPHKPQLGPTDEKGSKMQAFVFVLALSLHSFLEGLGLGNISKEGELISYVIGLVSHKWLEAFALGMTVYNAKFSFTITSAFYLFYSVLTPIGIVVGIALSFSMVVKLNRDITIVILTGLALGSFLFVACIEMITPEFTVIDRTSIRKFACVCLGFISMAIVAGVEA